MHSITVLLLIVGLASAAQIEAANSFETDSVNTFRQMVAQKNINIVKKHNSDPSRSFDMKAYPQFIGFTQEELAARLLNKDGLKMPDQSDIKIETPLAKLTPIDLGQEKFVKGSSVDLTQYVRSVIYNQGYCGNCWAYSTADGINMLQGIRRFSRPDLSMQHLTDCDGFNSSLTYQNNGCQGGDLQYAMWYVTNYGLYSLANYPINYTYTVNQGIRQPCRTISGATKYKISGWYLIYNPSYQDCNIRATYIGYGYTISTALYANNYNFLYYYSGILSACPASNTVDHAVIMVGYSTNSSPNYIKIKNSWGTGWG